MRQTRGMARDPHAVDGPVAATLRFAVELVAWVAVPWAVSAFSVPLAVATLLVLLLLPAVFNVPGDKHVSGRPVSGPVRIGIELLLMGCAVAGAAYAWPRWAAVTVAVVVAGALLANLPRWRWMLSLRGSRGADEDVRAG